jgi:abhydrolase domain-containing protein 17
VDLLGPWHDQGFGIFAYDYPGYGQSTGKPTEASCERAIETAWNHLTGPLNVAPATIVVVGRSIGSGPAVWLCTRHQPAGLILISPMMSVYRVRLPAPIFPGDRFPNLARMPGVHCPLLVVHGEADTIIGPRHGRRLHDAHPGSDKTLLMVPGAGHNDLFHVGGDELDQAILSFAERCCR